MEKPRFDVDEMAWFGEEQAKKEIQYKPRPVEPTQNRKQRRAFQSKVRKIIKKKVKQQNAKRKANSHHHDGAPGLGEVDMGKDFY